MKAIPFFSKRSLPVVLLLIVALTFAIYYIVQKFSTARVMQDSRSRRVMQDSRSRSEVANQNFHSDLQDVLKIIRADDFSTQDNKLFNELVFKGDQLFPVYSHILNSQDSSNADIGGVFMILTFIESDCSIFAEKGRWLLMNGDRRTWIQILSFLGKHGSHNDAAIYISLMYDADPSISRAAAESLAKQGDESDIIAFNLWLKSNSHRDNARLREAVARCKFTLQERFLPNR